MKLSTLLGISAAITGAVAISGAVTISGNHSVTVSTITVTDIISSTAISPIPDEDEVHISLGNGEHCSNTNFHPEFFMRKDYCYSHRHNFTTVRPRLVDGMSGLFDKDRCVLVTFSDMMCSAHGAIISDFTLDDSTFMPACLEVYTQDHQHVRIPALAVKWVCSADINKEWLDPFAGWTEDMSDSELLSIRDVDTGRDHVTVAPADNLNCNSAQNRDTDTKVHGRCHSFKKPFSSLQATVHRAAGDSKIGGSEPCSVLVFSDKQCSRDGAEIVDLNNTPALGVCHNVTLHHGKDTAAIAGHSWKWVCGRQNIDNCLKPIAHHSKHHTKAHTSVVKSATKTVTATTSLACTMTTESAHYLDVHTSVVTLKPVTHTSTSVFTKTMTQVRTKLITSVATDVSTVLHSVTKPYTTTYMVCDAEENSQA